MAQLVLEWLIFVVMTVIGVPVAAANVVARAIAAGMGFWFNGKWTFNKSAPPSLGIVHLGRYLTLWVSTTFFSTLAVMLAARGGGIHVAWIIKPLADLLLACVGFIVSKYWIYR